MRLKPRILISCILTVVFGWLFHQGESAYGQGRDIRRVTFQTEDGWTIVGTLYIPVEAQRMPVPAVILLSEPKWVVQTIHHTHLSKPLTDKGMAALTIDMRGTGTSLGKKEFELFSPAEIAAMQLDIRAAVTFLSTQRNIDARRIGVFGAGVTSDYVVREASENPAAIKALVLSTAALSKTSREYIQTRWDLPVLALVTTEESKKDQALAAEPYFLSENKNSALIFGIARGASLFDRPDSGFGIGLEQGKEPVSEWLSRNLKALGTETEVSFESDDGWTIRGNLYMPDGLGANAKVPGVVFVHGVQHDRQTWYYLAREVVRSGKAVLLFDWRGTGKSRIEKEEDAAKWLESTEVDLPMPMQEFSKIHLDVKAAIQFMASQKQVDSNRLALVAATATNNHSIRAAIGDPRIKTMVGLSFYGPDPDVKQYLSITDIPLFLIASTSNAVAMRGVSLAEGTQEVYRLSKSKMTELLLYDDAGRGSDMLKTKPELYGMIVRWLDRKLMQ